MPNNLICHPDADILYTREYLKDVICHSNDPDGMSDGNLPPHITPEALPLKQKALFQLELNKTISMPSWSSYTIGCDWTGEIK